MTKTSLLSALAATGYIVLVSVLMFYGSNLAPAKDTVLAPIAMISLFTLSAAVMGYLFVGQPLQLYLDGKKKEAVDFFFKTTSVFGVLTLATLISMLINGV